MSGTDNAMLQQWLVPVRLLYDCLIERGCGSPTRWGGAVTRRAGAVRPVQPSVPDRKTSERMHLLFSYRAQRIGHRYLNDRTIPALCAKAGVPTSDVRGKITSRRARAPGSG